MPRSNSRVRPELGAKVQCFGASKHHGAMKETREHVRFPMVVKGREPQKMQRKTLNQVVYEIRFYPKRHTAWVGSLSTVSRFRT